MKLFEIVGYKKRKREKLKQLVQKYGLAADVAEAAREPELARQYLNTAIYFQRQAEDVRTSKLSNWKMFRKDRKAEYEFNRLYVGAVELFL